MTEMNAPDAPAQVAPPAAPAAASPADASAPAAASPSAQTATTAAPAPTSAELVASFFKTSAAGKTAAAALKKSAEVGVRFTDAPGDYRFTAEDGTPRLLAGAARDPDFELTFGPAAARALAARPDADVGDLGILFFQHMLAHEPDAKIRVKLHSGLIKLTMRGYLGVLSAGGSKVFGWLANKGLKGPGAVASALSRLKKS